MNKTWLKFWTKIRRTKICVGQMVDLHEGEQTLFTECQNSAAFRSYSILKFATLVGSFKKEITKNLKFRIFCAKRIRGRNFCPTSLKFAPEHPTIQANNLNFWIFDILKNGGFMAIFVVKNGENCRFWHFFRVKLA